MPWAASTDRPQRATYTTDAHVDGRLVAAAQVTKTLVSRQTPPPG